MGVERTLKQSCCGKDTLAMLIACFDFTVEMLYTFSKNKQYTGRSIWALAMTVLCLLKKAISLVPKLSPTIVVIDKSCAIIQYASGQTEASFHQYIDIGMYEMSKSEENRGENAELMQTSACASLAGSLTDVDNGSDFNKEKDNEVIKLADNGLEGWNPFNGVTAPAGYAYCGKLAFICLEPASKFIAKFLRQVVATPKIRRRGRIMHTAVFAKYRRKRQLWSVQFAARGECPYRQK